MSKEHFRTNILVMFWIMLFHFDVSAFLSGGCNAF